MEKVRKSNILTDSDWDGDIVVKMASGNPGAVQILTAIVMAKAHAKIKTLDRLGIYGSDIYILYNDICERNGPNMAAVITAVELGFLDEGILIYACSRQDRSGREMIPVKELYGKVVAHLQG